MRVEKKKVKNVHRISERPESLPIPDLLWVDSQYRAIVCIMRDTRKYTKNNILFKNGTASVNVVIDMAP